MPSSAVSTILRASSKKHGDPLNILTFVTHERYESFLSKTGHNFFSLTTTDTKDWNSHYGPIPSNYHILKSKDSNIRVPLHLDIDLVLSQSKFGQFQILEQIATRLHLPMVNLEHTLPVDSWSPENFNLMKNMTGDINIFITKYNMSQWGYEEGRNFSSIYHGIDTDLFSPSKEDKREPHALSVVNDWINRDYCCGFNIWKQISEEIPTKVVGDTPGLSEPAKSVDDLVNQYRSSQVFLNTSTLSPIPMSLLEAMSCGCAVVSTNNCAIPEVIKDGENGFFFDNPAEARQKISMLLSNPELARRIGQNARDTILSNFSEGVFIDKWNDIFRRASNMVYTGVN